MFSHHVHRQRPHSPLTAGSLAPSIMFILRMLQKGCTKIGLHGNNNSIPKTHLSLPYGLKCANTVESDRQTDGQTYTDESEVILICQSVNAGHTINKTKSNVSNVHDVNCYLHMKIK